MGLAHNFHDFLGNDLFPNYFDLDNLRDLDDALYNFLYNDWYFHDFFHNAFDRDSLFDNTFDFLVFRDHVMDWHLHFNNFSVDHYSIDNFFYFNDLGDFHLSLDNLFLEGRHFNNLFSDGWHFHQLFHNVIDNLDDFNRHMDNFFHLDILRHFDNFFHVFLYGNDLRHFHNALHCLFYDAVHFHYLGVDSENLKDIIHIDNVEDFLVDHSDYALIQVQNSTVAKLEGLQLLKESLKKDTEVELHSAGLGTGVGVDILDSD